MAKRPTVTQVAETAMFVSNTDRGEWTYNAYGYHDAVNEGKVGEFVLATTADLMKGEIHRKAYAMAAVVHRMSTMTTEEIQALLS